MEHEYKGIDLIIAFKHGVSEDVAKEVIDHRIKRRESTSKKVMERAWKISEESHNINPKLHPSPDDALLRWLESGWTGIHHILNEAKKDLESQNIAFSNGVRSTRDLTLKEELNREWANDATEIEGRQKRLN